MTKIVTYFNLFPIPDPKEFLGIAADSDTDNVIASLTRNIVVVLKISTQKQIHSWSVVEKLSSKIVYDPRSDKYVGVFANHALRLWDTNTPDINKIKKLKFQKSIAELINDAEDTWVLYSDGSCELLATAIESRKEQREIALTFNKMMIHARVFMLADGQKMLTYFEKQHQTDELNLVCITMQQQGESSEKRVFPLKRENVQISGYAVIEGDSEPMLLTIWQDKRIFLLSLAADVSGERAPGNFVSMLSELNVEKKISLLGISSNSVAIYGANHGQEGSSLLLYNTQFKVTKAKEYFKVFFDFSRLWASNEHILLTMGQNISVISYQMSKAYLSELLGTQSNNDNFKLIDFEHINEEEALEQCIKYDDGKHVDVDDVATATKELREGKQKDTKIINADGHLVPFESVEAFDNELNTLNRLHIDGELLEVNTALDEVQVALMSNPGDTGSSNLIIQMIVRQMERCGASEQEIAEKLLTVLIKADQQQHVLSCLRRYANIAEKDLAKVLRYALSKCDTAASWESSNKEDAVETLETKTNSTENGCQTATNDDDYPNIDLLAQRYATSTTTTSTLSHELLNAVLACSFDADTITVHIRNELEYDGVVLLLQHLYALLNDPAIVFPTSSTVTSPSIHLETQVFTWFGVILSAHLQKLALAKDIKLLNILYDWQLVLEAYKQEQSDLVELGASLYKLVQRRTTQQKKSYSKWYSIDEVVLY